MGGFHARRDVAAADEVGMRRKLHSTAVVGLGRRRRGPYVAGRELRASQAWLASYRYFGLSRCTTFTRYPALRSRLLTSSAIMTERCCPPVQPKEMVR